MLTSILYTYSYVLLATNLFAFNRSTRPSMSDNSLYSPFLFLARQGYSSSPTHEKIYRTSPPQVTLDVALKKTHFLEYGL